MAVLMDVWYNAVLRCIVCSIDGGILEGFVLRELGVGIGIGGLVLPPRYV